MDCPWLDFGCVFCDEFAVVVGAREEIRKLVLVLGKCPIVEFLGSVHACYHPFRGDCPAQVLGFRLHEVALCPNEVALC